MTRGAPVFMDAVVGLDLAGTNCGFSFLSYDIKGSSLIPVDKFSCRFTATKEGFHGIVELVDQVVTQTLEIKPSLVAMEDLIKTPFSYSGNDLAESAAAMKFALYRKFPILLVHPSKVKSFVLPRRAEKREITRAAIDMFGWSPVCKRQNEIGDEMDAVIVAHIGAHYQALKRHAIGLEYLQPWQRAIFMSEEQTKIRKKREIKYFTGLLQVPEFLIRGDICGTPV